MVFVLDPCPGFLVVLVDGSSSMLFKFRFAPALLYANKQNADQDTFLKVLTEVVDLVTSTFMKLQAGLPLQVWPPCAD